MSENTTTQYEAMKAPGPLDRLLALGQSKTADPIKREMAEIEERLGRMARVHSKDDDVIAPLRRRLIARWVELRDRKS